VTPAVADADADPQFELLTLLRQEFAAGGIECGVSAAVGEVPAQLIVDVAGGNSVHVCFLPDHDQPPVLQYLVALDVDVDPGFGAASARFAALVNASLPITGFEVSESVASVVFRYIQPVSVHPLDPGVIAWPLSMIHFALRYYADLIAAACTGTEYDDLVARFEAMQAELLSEGD
jgi:hypothetical protein